MFTEKFIMTLYGINNKMKFTQNIKKFKIRNITLVLPVLIISSSMMLAQEKPVVNKFDMKECINYALKNQATVKNAELSESISRENVKAVFSQFFPQVTASATYQYNINRQTSIIGGNKIQIGSPHQLQGFIDVTQTLFDPTLIGSSTAANLEEDLSAGNTGLSKIDMVAGVMKAYYGVLVSKEQLSLLDANITRTEKSLNDTKYEYQNGLAQKVDVDRIQVLVNNAVTQKSTALRNIRTQMQTLKYYMGMPVTDSLVVSGAISDSLLTKVNTVPGEQFYKNRIEYSQAKTQLELNRLIRANVVRSYLPKLSAFYTYEAPFYGNTFNGMFDAQYHPTSYVGVQLSVPIFTGLKRIYQYQAAEMNVEISTNTINDLKNNIELEYNSSYRQYENAVDNLKTQKENTKLAQLNYDNLKYQYDNGVQPLIEVLNAETTLLQAQNDYINALYQALVNKVDLEKSLGRIKY